MPAGMDMRRLGGRNFARIRRDRGLTQEQAEELSGFSQQHISGLEQVWRNPTVVTLYELALALGVTPFDLLSDEPDQAGARRTKRGLRKCATAAPPSGSAASNESIQLTAGLAAPAAKPPHSSKGQPRGCCLVPVTTRAIDVAGPGAPKRAPLA
jgi:transcriptional regulator with XRE-family HTH domain